MKAAKHQNKQGKRFVGFRVEADIYAEFKREAAANNRSVAGEIKHRLAQLMRAK